MGEQYMTMAEIEKKYPNEWVLINKPTLKARSHEVVGGVVLAHSPDRGDFNRQLLELKDSPRLGDFAVRHTGEAPAEESFDALWFKHAL
jgi:hypothetical protein